MNTLSPSMPPVALLASSAVVKVFIFSRGPAYFDRNFSAKFISLIADEYDDPSTANKLWDDILADHIRELTVFARLYRPGVVYEFDSLTDLTKFDRDFFANVDSRILDNICNTLDCSRGDISDVKPVNAGLTNLSTMFTVKGVRYIYRHPGSGTEKIINREAEAFALGVARDLGLDDTFLYEDPDEVGRYRFISRGAPSWITAIPTMLLAL